jgi:hypothetical protein
MGAPGLALREGRHGEGAKRNVDRCTTGGLLVLGELGTSDARGVLLGVCEVAD